MAERSSKTKIIYIVGLLVFLILAVGIAIYQKMKPQTEIISPRMGPVVESVYGLGTVVAPQTYQLKTGVNQVMREVYVKEGDTVKAGDLLVKFDEPTTARAPFGGTITSVPFRKGELLFPSVAAVTLVNLNDLYLEVSLEQQAVLRVKRGQKAFVSFESIRSERLEGEVQSVYPRENQFIVRITLQKFPSGVLPGMTADVAIEVGRKGQVLSIPLRAISGGRITLRRAGTVVKESVQLGVVDGEWAEVISKNVEPSDEIWVRSK